MRSRDLVTFSEPFPVLSYDRPYEQAGKRGHSLSNPFVIADGGGWSLYYSAGLTFVPDCGFSEPTFVCLAKSGRPDGGFVKSDAPIIRPDPENPLFNLCSGCLKVYRLADCYAGIQNGIQKFFLYGGQVVAEHQHHGGLVQFLQHLGEGGKGAVCLLHKLQVFIGKGLISSG